MNIYILCDNWSVRPFLKGSPQVYVYIYIYIRYICIGVCIYSIMLSDIHIRLYMNIYILCDNWSVLPFLMGSPQVYIYIYIFGTYR